MRIKLLSIFTILFAAFGYAQDFTINDIGYTITSPTTVSTFNYIGAGGNIIIPAIVTNSGTDYNVTVIGDSTFFSDGVTAVTIPNGVTSIEANAFSNNSIASVILPESLTSIGNSAFQNNNLTTISFPENVSSIGGFTFASNAITTVFANGTSVFPTLDINAFSNRTSIDVTIPENTTLDYQAVGWNGFNSLTEDGTSLNLQEFNFEEIVSIITNNNTLFISSSNSINFKSYMIYSISGAEALKGTNNEVSLTGLASGIYIIEVLFEEGVVRKKIAK